MNDPLYLNDGSLSDSEYKEGASKVLTNIPLTVFAVTLGVICLCSSINQIFNDDGLSILNILTGILSIMLIAFTPVLPRIQANGLYKRLCSSLNIKEGESIKTRSMFFKDQLVYISNESTTKIEFADIKKFYLTKNTLALRTRDNVLIVLPRSGFLGGSAEDIVDLIKQKK